MNWNYGSPIVNGQYLCCIKDCSNPVIVEWNNGEWGAWHIGKGQDQEWFPLDKYTVVCYIDLNEIPMPEGW